MSHHTARSLGTGTANLPLTVAVLVDGTTSTRRGISSAGRMRFAQRYVDAVDFACCVVACARARACVHVALSAGTSSKVSLHINAPRRQPLASCRL